MLLHKLFQHAEQMLMRQKSAGGEERARTAEGNNKNLIPGQAGWCLSILRRMLACKKDVEGKCCFAAPHVWLQLQLSCWQKHCNWRRKQACKAQNTLRITPRLHFDILGSFSLSLSSGSESISPLHPQSPCMFDSLHLSVIAPNFPLESL